MADYEDFRTAPDDPASPPLAYVSHQSGLPTEAIRMGMDRNTEEGALVAMAGSLSPARPAHRLVAWVILACFVGPLLMTLVHEFS
jgi:hypothetical protein